MGRIALPPQRFVVVCSEAFTRDALGIRAVEFWDRHSGRKEHDCAGNPETHAEAELLPGQGAHRGCGVTKTSTSLRINAVGDLSFNGPYDRLLLRKGPEYP